MCWQCEKASCGDVSVLEVRTLCVSCRGRSSPTRNTSSYCPPRTRRGFLRSASSGTWSGTRPGPDDWCAPPAGHTHTHTHTHTEHVVIVGSSVGVCVCVCVCVCVASCYLKVAGLILLVCMSKCLWVRNWTPNCSWCSGCHGSHHHHQRLNYCQSLWTQASDNGK